MRKKLLFLAGLLSIVLAMPVRSAITRDPYCWYCPTTTGACKCPPNTELAGKLTTCTTYINDCWRLIPP